MCACARALIARTRAVSSGVSGDAKVMRELGAAYYQLGKYEEAVRALEEALTLDAEDSFARYHLCLSYIALRDRASARPHYEALQRGVSTRDAHFVKQLSAVMERPPNRKDESEQEEFRRLIKGARHGEG